MPVTVSITGSSPSTVVLTLTCPPRRSSNSYVNSRDPSRSTTVINERCKTPSRSFAVASTAGNTPGSTTSRTTFPSISDSSSPCRFRNPSRYRSSLVFRSPSGSVAAILGGPLRVGGLFRRTILLAPFGGSLLGLLLLLELLLDLLRDPADVRLGGRRHALTFEDVSALERPYVLETRRLTLADVRVLALGEVLQDLAVLGDERGTRPLVADLLVALDLLLKRHNPEDQGFRTRRTPWHVDVDRDHAVRPHQHGVAIEKRSAAYGAGAHRDDPLGLGHLLVEARHPLGHLRRYGTRHYHHVGLSRRGREEPGPEAVEVVVGHAGRHHLDGATREPELQGPQGVLPGPVEQLVRTRRYHVRLVELLHYTHLRAPFIQA